MRLNVYFKWHPPSRRNKIIALRTFLAIDNIGNIWHFHIINILQ